MKTGIIADAGRMELLEKARGNEAVASRVCLPPPSAGRIWHKHNFKLLSSFLSHFAILSWKSVFLEPLIMQKGFSKRLQMSWEVSGTLRKVSDSLKSVLIILSFF